VESTITPEFKMPELATSTPALGEKWIVESTITPEFKMPELVTSTPALGAK